jgi:hypothetical protein
MNESALNLVAHILPDVPLRQFVVTVPFPLRFPLAFDGALLGQVVRIFVDTVDGWYRRRHVDRGLPPGETGAVAVIQRANGDLRLNPHVHAICLDGVYSADRDGKGLMFHPAPAPAQDEIESLVGRASKRILRFLQRRKVITLVTAPGDGEVTVVGDETIGEKDPLLARLLAAAAAGASPAGPANKRKPLLRKTFGCEIVCQKCQSPLRLIALIKSEDIAKMVLTAMHLPTEVPELHPARARRLTLPAWRVAKLWPKTRPAKTG